MSQQDYSHRQFQFDEILVYQGSRGEPPKPVHPPVLSYEKKYVYAGTRGNWRLNFKDLRGLETSATSRDTFNDDDEDSIVGYNNNNNNSGRRGKFRGRSPRGGGRGRGGTSSETLELSLSSRKLSIKCITSKGVGRHTTAKAKHDLEVFLEGIKKAHRRARKDKNEKNANNNGEKYREDDPYAFDDKVTTALGSKNKAWLSGHKTKTYGHHGQSSAQQRQKGGGGSSSRVVQVTPAQRGGVYLSPQKKRSAGAFQSPARRRANAGNGSAGNAASGGGDEDPSTVGNVVREQPPSSPVRSLKLPPKSPRNATPSRLRSSSAEVGSERKLRSIGNQLQGISGGNIELKKRLETNDKVKFDFDEDSDDGFDGSQTKGSVKEEEGEKASMKEEKKGAPKRRRLQRASGNQKVEDGNDSDVEFDDPSPTSCKKKLRLSFLDDKEEEEEDKMKDETTAKESSKEQVSESSEPSPKEQDVEEPPSTTPTEPPSKEDPSTADKALAPSPVKKPPKKGTIASFFSAKPSTSKPGTKKETSKKSSPPPSSSDTYGAALSTPSKRVCAESKTPVKSNATTSPSTPPRSRTECRPTPVTRQMQRKTSRYFGNVGNDGADDIDEKEDSRRIASLSGDEMEGSTLTYSDEDVNDYYYDKNDQQEKIATEEQPRRRRPYGRLVGRSRLTSQLQDASWNNSGRKGTANTGSMHKSPISRLDFDSSKAGHIMTEPRTRIPMRNANMLNAPSTADRILGKNPYNTTKSPAFVPNKGQQQSSTTVAQAIPGIQNLGNTCYLSASLQTIFAIPSFLRDLYATYQAQSPAKKLPLTQALLEVAVAVNAISPTDVPLISPNIAKSSILLSNKKACGNPTALKKQMDVLTEKFAGYEQRDAHEFLSDLVDFLHDELAASPPAGAREEGGEGAATDENSNPNEKKAAGPRVEEKEKKKDTVAAMPEGGVLPTDKYFHLNVRVCLECDSCGYSRSKEEMYRHLSVDVGEDSELEQSTVERSLTQFFQPEKRELKCEKCELGKTATQTMEIISCPNALLLHFKRFIVTQEMKGGPNASGNGLDGKENKKVVPPRRMEMVLRKNKAKIPLEESLSIIPFIGKKEHGPSGKYCLRGVVHHVGSTASSGHYTTCAKRALLPDQQEDNGDKQMNSKHINDTSKDNEEHWVFFDDRVGLKKDVEYVTHNESNERNCYMALYQLE